MVNFNETEIKNLVSACKLILARSSCKLILARHEHGNSPIIIDELKAAMKPIEEREEQMRQENPYGIVKSKALEGVSDLHGLVTKLDRMIFRGSHAFDDDPEGFDEEVINICCAIKKTIDDIMDASMNNVWEDVEDETKEEEIEKEFSDKETIKHWADDHPTYDQRP